MILDDILVKRRAQLNREMQKINLEEIKRMALSVGYQPVKGFFRSALIGDEIAVIAEVKKASPSKGIIREAFVPVDIAAEYERAGVNAMSILTEEHFFMGSSEYLKEIRKIASIPILRKDFIFDEYQIYEAKAIGANAILLIIAILDKDVLSKFMLLAKGLGLDCLVEVHDEKELCIALGCDADIIGINNRNLKTFEVDIKTSGRLKGLIPEGCVVVSESGISSNDDIKVLSECGVNAVLVGENFMKSGDITAAIKALRYGV